MIPGWERSKGASIEYSYAMEKNKICLNEDVTFLQAIGRLWIPADRPPEKDEHILLSFENYSIPQIGRYEPDKDGGGAYYVGDDDKSCVMYGLFVNAWMYLPDPYIEK